MPFYYTSAWSVSTNATPNTETDNFRYLTVSPRPCNITRISVGASGAAVDAQLFLDIRRMSVASTTGSAFVPEKQDPGLQAAVTTPFTAAITKGTPNTNPALYLALNSRGTWQWVATNPDEAIALITAGGANGNIDVLSNASTASVPMRVTQVHWE
jgi:hypothetical protein